MHQNLAAIDGGEEITTQVGHKHEADADHCDGARYERDAMREPPSKPIAIASAHALEPALEGSLKPLQGVPG